MHSITTRATPKRQMKETQYTRHLNIVEPMMVEKDRKATLQALHTDAVNNAVKTHEGKVVIDYRPPPISNSEKYLTRKDTQPSLNEDPDIVDSYKSSIKDASLNVCADCNMMSSISSFARPTRPQSHRQIYEADRRTLSGNSAISRRKTQIEMNMY